MASGNTSIGVSSNNKTSPDFNSGVKLCNQAIYLHLIIISKFFKRHVVIELIQIYLDVTQNFVIFNLILNEFIRL